MRSCRKNGGKKTEKLIVQNCVRIDWDSAFWTKRFFRKFWFSAKASDSRYDSDCALACWVLLNIAVYPFETPDNRHLELPENGHNNSQCCVCLHGEKSLTGFRLCATTSIPTTLNNMQQGVQNETVLAVVGQQCCVHLQRSFKDQSYSVKKSTNNEKSV